MIAACSRDVGNGGAEGAANIDGDPHNDCIRATSFGRLNDWKPVELTTKTAESAELVEEDAELQLQVK